mmetsp:Transcript_9790/g.14913  ORF Transcript_9790/g.14913 Transcript_9790/m.14913 type:complete len:290 (-) Transcript_9790:31-900(-)
MTMTAAALSLSLICFISVVLGWKDDETYNESAAITNLYYAYGGYCPQAQLEAWTCKWCQNNSQFEIYKVRETGLSEWDLQSYSGYNPSQNQIVVSFRGSYNTENWINDLAYFQSEYGMNVSNAYVHDGFKSAWNELYKTGVQTDWETLTAVYPDATTLVTGHSLGAAIATLATLNFTRMQIQPVFVYTYGCPRVGNLEFSEYFTDSVVVHWRVVNVHDVVPTLPLANVQGHGIISPYHHSAIEIWYTSDEPLQYKQCPGNGESVECDYVERSANDHLEYMNLHETCLDV